MFVLTVSQVPMSQVLLIPQVPMSQVLPVPQVPMSQCCPFHRYRCLKCFNCDLCQQCFFTGRVSKGHKLSHPLHEYCTEVSDDDNMRTQFSSCYTFWHYSPSNGQNLPDQSANR